MTRILIIYHTITGNVGLVAEQIAAGARTVENTVVTVRSVQEVMDQELLDADGIAIGSPKFMGSFSPEIALLLQRIYQMHPHFHYKVGTAFTGSPSQYGGQEHVIDDLIHGMMQTGKMIMVGDVLGGTGFIGGYTVGEPDEKAISHARGLGERLADVAGRMKRSLGQEIGENQ